MPFRRARVQITMLADTYAACKALADAMRTALNSYSDTVSGTVVHSVLLDNEHDDHGDNVGIDVIRQDYLVLYT